MSATSPPPSGQPSPGELPPDQAPLQPPAAALAQLPHGESQWTIILKEFRKRRGAVLCFCLLVLLAATTIFAPFLANDRPIAYRGYNRSDYGQSLSAARTLIGQLVSPPLDEQGEPIELDRSQVRASVLTLLDGMASQVAAENAESIRQVRTEFAAQTSGDEPDSAAALTGLQQALSDLAPQRVQFESRWRFPVLAMLDFLDVAFLALTIVFLASPLWRRLLRWKWGRFHPVNFRLTAAILVGVPLLVGLAWWLSVPTRNDRTRYKSGLLAANDASGRAPVIYEAVLWPPIPYGLDENDLDAKKSPPVLWWGERRAKVPRERVLGPNALPEKPAHWLGTDNLGRDIACRMLWGGRVSLAVGVVSVAIYITIGVIVGAVAGYARGWTDLVISRLIEIVICFPTFFLILTIVAFLGPSMFMIMVVIGLTSWTGVARLVRAEFLRLSEQEFVLAGRALGYSPARLIFRHILPNAMAPVLVSATFGIAGAILTESTLSFLGLGITVPKPSWGGILSDGRSAIFSAPWIIAYPGLAIFVTITWYNLVGEAFRDAADPRLRGSR